MANSVSDYMARSKENQARYSENAAREIENFAARNPDIVAAKRQQAVNTQYRAVSHNVEENNDLSLERRRVANTLGENLKDTGIAVASGLSGAVRGVTGTVGLAATGYKNIYEAVKGEELSVADDVIHSMTEITGQDYLRDTLANAESDLTKSKRAEFNALMKRTDISEGDRAKGVIDFYAKNPGMLGLDTAKVVPQSVAEMVAGNKILGAIGKAKNLGTAAKVGISAGGSAFGNAVVGVADDPNNQLDPRSIIASGGKAALVGGVTGAASKLLPEGDIDRLFFGGQGFGKNGLIKGSVMSGSREVPEEVVGEAGEQFIDNWDNRRPLDYSVAAHGVQGGLLGFSAGVTTGLPANAGAGINNAVDTVNTKLANRGGTLAENADMTHEKFDPVRAYKNAEFMAGSANIEERTEANNTIAKMFGDVNTRAEEIKARAAAETDPVKREAILQEYADFEDNVVKPLQAEVRNTMNAAKANKEVDTSVISQQADELSESLTKATKARAMKYDKEVIPLQSQAMITRPAAEIQSDVNNKKQAPNLSQEEQKVWEISKLAIGKKPTFKTASEKYGVPMGVLTAIVAVESGGKFSAKSPTGALGLLQHTGIFRKEYGLTEADSIGVSDAAINATADYLAKSYEQFGNWNDAILSYNAGRAGAASFKDGTFRGTDARKNEVGGYVGKVNKYLGGGQSSTASKYNSGDGFVSNDSLKGLRIKSGESTRNGQVRGYTADFAKVTQDILGDSLRHFSSFNDGFHKNKGGRHPKGQAFDISLNGNVTREQSIEAVKQIEKAAAEQGYSIKILNEYTDPSANSTGGHIHVSVLGRTKATAQSSEQGKETEIDSEIVNPDIVFEEEEKSPEEAEVEKQQEVLNEVKAKKARAVFSSLSEEELDKSVLFSQAQKDALRKLLGVKKAANANKNQSQVNKEVYEGNKGKTVLESNLGIKQYDAILQQSISVGDVATTTKHLDMLDNFADNHISKNQVIQENLPRASRKNPLHIAPNENNEWGIVDRELYTDAEFEDAGGLTFFGPNDLTRAIQTEAKDLSDFRDGYKAFSAETLGLDTSVQAPADLSSPIAPVSNQNPVVGNTAPTSTPVETGSTVQTPVETAPVEAPTPTAAVPQSNEVRVVDENAIDITDDLFGFNELNQYGLNTVTDESLGKNKSKIDEVLNQVVDGNARVPVEGVGAQLKSTAPKTFQYLNEAIQSKVGVDNAATVEQAPRENLPRSTVESKSKRIKGKASNTIKPREGSNELSNKSVVGKKGYRNTYQGTAKNGTGWTLNVVRSKKSHNVARVVVDIVDPDGNKSREVLDFDPMISDGDIIDSIEANYQIAQVLQHTDESEQSVEEEVEMATVKGRTFPAELKKATVIEPVIDTLFELIDSDTISAKERKLYTSIIKPILNFNPGLKIRISETVKSSSYDRTNNTIYVKAGIKGSNILQEATRMVVYSATANLVIRLQDSTYENLKAEGKDIVKLNKDLSKAKADIHRLVTLSSKEYLGLDSKTKARLLEALSSNDKLLGAVVSDPKIAKFLRSVEVTEGKVKSSLFRRISNSLRTFFNIGNSNQTATLFDRMMDITSRTVELQARNSEVSFTKSEQGKVGVFQDVIQEEVDIERAKPFKERNQLLAGFKQSSTLSKPLSAVANLASKLKIDLMQGLGTLVSESPTKVQRDQLVDFLQFRDEMAQHLLDTFGKHQKSEKSTADFNYSDLKGFLEQDGIIDENTLTSVALATYNWAIEFGNKNLTDDTTIKKFLNIEPDAKVFIPNDIRSQYEFLTTIKNYSALDLGRSIADSLNIRATDFVKLEAQSAFESSLGEWAVNAMQSANLIHLHTMPTKQHLENISRMEGDENSNFKGDDVKSLSTNGVVTFISVSGFAGGQKNRRLSEIASKNKGTAGYMGKLFGTEIGLRMPTLVPPSKVKTTIKRTKSVISDVQTKFMAKMQEEPISINEDMHKALTNLLNVDRDTTLELIGALVTEETLAGEHVEDRASMLSAAEGVLRDLENAEDFIGGLPVTSEGKLAPFYDGVYGAKNTRMHYNSNLFNFQTSKLHRSLAEYSNFETTINLDGLKDSTPSFHDSEGNLTTLGLFFKAIAERAEGTEDYVEAALVNTKYSKGFTQDKIPGEVFLPVFHKYLTTDPLVAEAVVATSKLIQSPDKMTKADTAKIAELVKHWEGGAESLKALVEYTKLTLAFENGSELTTSIGLQSDGVNNGIALANVLLGTASNKFLAQVGMFVKGSKYSNFFDTRTDKSLQDYYEGFGTALEGVFKSEWNKGKNELNEDGSMTTQAVLLSLNTSFFKRANMKALLIPFGYSAGMKRIKSLAYGQFLQDVKGTFKQLAKKDFTDPKVQAELKELKEKLSYLAGKNIDLPTGLDLLEYSLDYASRNAIAKKYEAELGGVVEQAMKVYAANFIEQRQLNVKLQGAASEAYLTVRDFIIKGETAKYIDSLVESGMTRKEAEALHALEGIPAKYFTEVIQPILHKLVPTVKTPFNHNTDSNDSNFIMLDETSKVAQDAASRSMGYRVNSNGMLAAISTVLPVKELIQKSVGVFGNSAQVQGMDAYIAAYTSALGGNVNINVHDAGISGLANYFDMVNMQNKATFEGLRDYAMQAQSLKTLVDTLATLSDMVSSEELDPAIFDMVGETVLKTLGIEESGSLESGLDAALHTVRRSQKSKMAIIRKLETVHQYAGEGAPYVVSESDTAKVDKAEQDANKLLDSIEETIKGLVKSTPSKPVEKEATGIESISEMFKEFKEEAGESFEAIDSMVDYVMSRLEAVNPDIKFKWEDTVKGPVKGVIYNGSYTIQGNIIVLSKASFNKIAPYARTTVLAHELIHAVSAHTIVNSKNPTTRAAIKELNRMLQELKAVKQTQFTVGKELANIEELIAYGLTEPDFLRFIGENLKGEYKSPTRASNGLVRFIKAVSAFFSGTKKFNENIDTFMRLADAVTKENYTSVMAPTLFHSVEMSDVLKTMDKGSVSNEFSEHLDGLIDRVIKPNYTSSPEATEQTRKIIDNASQRAITAGFRLSDKELHVMEVLKAIGTTYLDNHSGSKAAANMSRIYDSLIRQLKYEDFLADPSTATAAEVAIAKSKLGYIMNNDRLNKKEHLERLYALSLASEEFSNIIAAKDNSHKATQQDTWFNKVMSLFADMVGWVTSKFLNTNGLNAPQELKVLFEHLSYIDAKARANKQHLIDSSYEVITGIVSTPANWAANKLVKAMFGTFKFAGSKTTAFSALSSVFNTAAMLERTGVMNVVDQAVINNATHGGVDGSNRLTGFGELLNELSRTQGMKQTVEKQIRAVSKAGQARKTVSNQAADMILNYFKNGGKDLEAKAFDSISQVALRSDMSSLMNNGLSITRVMTLLTNDSELNNEIAKYEAKLSQVDNGNDIIMQTKSLGLYMAKEVATDFMVKNAESIAIGVGSWYETSMDSMNTELRDDIDVLASLYAVTMAGKDKRATLKALIAEDYDGVSATLKAHRDMVKQAKADFANNPYNYNKGYLPQDTHHLRSLRFAETTEDIAKLKRQGWVELTPGDLKQDKQDKTSARTLMLHNDISYQDYVSGALDMKDTHSKGTIVYDEGDMQALNRVSSAKLAARRQRAATKQYGAYNPMSNKHASMIANYSSTGELISYGYEMSGELRDTYLERNNNAVELLGMYQSNLSFKPEIVKTQEELAQHLYDDFEKGFRSDPRQFVTLDPNSADPKVREMYRMMPYAFRQKAKALFGADNPIVVRSNVFNSVFGFRAYSISNMFEKVTGDKNALEHLLTNTLTAVFGDKAQMKAIQFERGWQYAITQIKDFVVIRNIKVLMGNITANSLLLSLEGVAPVQQAKDFVSVWRNGKKYRELAAKVIAIDTDIAINQNRATKLRDLKRERSKAVRAMERNPMHKFMEAGLMSTIVEDVKVGKEDTAFKSDFEKELDKVADKLPNQIVTAFNWAVTSPGTPLHDFMAHTTQFSDLAAKYSLATHLMRQGKSMDDAIAVAQDNFINYDVPTSTGLDYLNRMGLFMFTKFFLRFQQVMMRKLNEKAGSTIAQHMGIEYFTGLSGVLDPFVLGRIGNNPLQAGPLNYGEAVGNISTVDFLTGAF